MLKYVPSQTGTISYMECYTSWPFKVETTSTHYYFLISFKLKSALAEDVLTNVNTTVYI